MSFKITVFSKFVDKCGTKIFVIYNNKYFSIITEIHTYGAYIPPSDEKDLRFKELFKMNGSPYWFSTDKSGKVFICLKKIKEGVEECLRYYSARDQIKLYCDLITAIVIHEHAHAIINVGVSEGSDELYIVSNHINRIEYKSVDETLAEWTELNYFRNNEEIAKIIIDYAGSGSFPAWPYG